MRTLLVSPYAVDTSVLERVLMREGLPATKSVDLQAGAGLANEPLNTFAAAVAVLPKPDDSGTTILVETGIALGAGLPVLLILPPEAEPPPALSAVPIVRTSLDNEEALALHVRLFVHSLATLPDRAVAQPTLEKNLLSPEVAAQYASRLRSMHDASRRSRGLAFEQLVVDLLRDSGAVLEQENRLDQDTRVDAVAVIPGEELRIGVLLVEAKLYSGPARLKPVERQLASYVLERGAGLGMVIYDSAGPSATPETTPLIISLRFDDLLEQLQRESLAEVVVRARNEAIHRL